MCVFGLSDIGHVFGGDHQAEYQKLKGEVTVLRTNLTTVSAEAKKDQKLLEKAKARAVALENKLKTLQQEQDQRLQQVQQLQKEAQQQKEQEALVKQRALEQELQELREKVKNTKVKRPRDIVPVVFDEGDDLDDTTTSGTQPPAKKPKQHIIETSKQAPQGDSTAMIEATVQRCMERYMSVMNPMVHQRPPQAPMMTSSYPPTPTYGSGTPQGYSGQYGQPVPNPNLHMSSGPAGMAYQQPAPSMMPSMMSNSGGGLESNPMMHMWPPQVTGTQYASSGMGGWGASGVGVSPSYPGPHTAQMPMTGSTGIAGPMEAKPTDKSTKTPVDFAQTGQFMTQFGTPEQQEAYAKFMQSLGGQ